jgi:excisionase family DNA binding protein
MTGSGKKVGVKRADQPNVMLTTGEACRILNVHSNTLRRWAATGMIKAYRISTGTHRRYRREDVAALLIEQDRFRQTDTEE